MITKDEVCTRVKVAYEQLEACHTGLCRAINRRDDCSFILEDLRIVMSKILAIQVELGMIKHEEDL